MLNAEGHHIKERELMRVRAKHRWLLRVPNGTKTFGGGGGKSGAKGIKRKREDGESMDRFEGMGIAMEESKLMDMEQTFNVGLGTFSLTWRLLTLH